MEIEELKKQAKVFRTRFKMLVEAQLDIIENEDWEELFEIELATLKTDTLRIIQLKK